MQTIVPMGHRGTPEGTVGTEARCLRLGFRGASGQRPSHIRPATQDRTTPVCLIRFSGDPRDINRDMQQTRERSVPDPPCEEKRHSLRPLAALIIPCAPGPPFPLQAPHSLPEHCPTISVQPPPRDFNPGGPSPGGGSILGRRPAILGDFRPSSGAILRRHPQAPSSVRSAQ